MSKKKKTGRRKRSASQQICALRVGQRILKARTALGLTQTDVANKCGWKATRVWKYETGHDSPSSKSIGKLARVLGISVQELIALANGDEDEDEEPARMTAGAA